MKSRLIRLMTTVLGLVAIAAMPGATRAADRDWKAVQQALGKAGQLQPGDVFRVGMPRTDLSVLVKGVPVKPGFALGSYAAFKQVGDHAMVMGDLVLLDAEVPAVMSGLFANGLDVTAVHNHLNDMSPHVMYMHYEGRGNAVQLAKGLRAALSASATPLESGPAPSPATPTTAGSTLDSKRIEQALGRQGRDIGGGLTVLFADLKSSMELLADRDPEEARRLLDPVLSLMIEAVHRYEGTVNQVMGDGIMALFGAPLAHEDHAVRACYTALDMQDAIRRHSAELRQAEGFEVQVRVGINSGDVVVRAIQNDLHMDYTAIGQTVHLAARMEQLATPGSTRITGATLQLVEGYVAVRSLGRVPVKGIGEPLDVYELAGVGAARTRLQVASRQGFSRFVGRHAEMEHLRRVLDTAARGSGQVVAVIGEPGVGKSRLFWELTRSHLTQGWLTLETSSVSWGKTFTEAMTHGEAAVRIAESTGHPHSLIEAQSALGRVHLDRGDHQRAIALFELGLGPSLARNIWDSSVFSGLGYAYALAGRVAQRLPLLQEAVERGQTIDAMGIGHAMRVSRLGEGYLLCGRLAEARESAQRALESARAQQERGNEAYALHLLGEIATHATGLSVVHAERDLQDALARSMELQMRPLVAHCRLSLGRLYHRSNRPPEARAQLAAAMTAYSELGMAFWQERAQAEAGKIE